MDVHEPFRLPEELQYWGWTMQQLKSGPRKNPGGWYQFIFWRLRGLAKGDEELPEDNESFRVKVRCPTLDEAFAEAVRHMRERSAALEPSGDYQRLMDENLRIRADIMKRAKEYFR